MQFKGFCEKTLKNLKIKKIACYDLYLIIRKKVNCICINDPKSPGMAATEKNTSLEFCVHPIDPVLHNPFVQNLKTSIQQFPL